MPIMLGADFFQRADQVQIDAFKTRLHESLLAAQNLDETDTEASLAFGQFFEATWQEAVLDMALHDNLAIAKYMNIRLMQDAWAQSELHRTYVESMLNSDEQFIRVEDGIAAVHQNILEQHYAK